MITAKNIIIVNPRVVWSCSAFQFALSHRPSSTVNVLLFGAKLCLETWRGKNNPKRPNLLVVAALVVRHEVRMKYDFVTIAEFNLPDDGRVWMRERRRLKLNSKSIFTIMWRVTGTKWSFWPTAKPKFTENKWNNNSSNGLRQKYGMEEGTTTIEEKLNYKQHRELWYDESGGKA